MSKENYPILFEDLIMTGAHSILNKKQFDLMNYMIFKLFSIVLYHFLKMI
jgi:hypothetical protein